MTSKTRNMLIGGLVLLAVVFLIGFVPQNRRAAALEGDLGQMRERVESLERDLRLARARDLASMTYIEIAKNNFGTASQLATQFFDVLRDVAGRTQDAQLRNDLEALLAKRDEVVAGLAKADPAMHLAFRELTERLFQTTRAR